MVAAGRSAGGSRGAGLLSRGSSGRRRRAAVGGVERRGRSRARPLAPCCLLAGCSFPPFARCRRHCTLEEQSSAGRIGAWQRWLSPLSLAFSSPLLGGKRLPAPPTILSNVPPPSTMLAFRRLPRQPTFRLRYVPPLDLHHLRLASPRASIPRSTHTPSPRFPAPPGDILQSFRKLWCILRRVLGVCCSLGVSWCTEAAAILGSLCMPSYTPPV